MSKITLSAILTILRLVLVLGEKVVRSVYTIIDLVDDGVQNASAPRPEWYDVLLRSINSLELVFSDLSGIPDSVTIGKPE